ncbi:Protein SYM1 [Phytophthora citrophthora]|uniref:Protein SYM1 n=1 Tax=Phytophthora citrophthora TaxID=4793 RepID=A0AAD9GNJ5_9STRA|nr:Protein SYM1 [Phytophthora citrophthora]
MRRLGLLYDGWLRRSPMVTKCVTSAVLFGLGDRIAQRLEKSRRPKDEEMEDDGALVSKSTARTMRMMIWGSVIFAPIVHTWVHFIERTVGSHGKVVVFKKVLLDAFVFAPSINTLFFTSTQMMQGKSVSQGVDFAVDRIPQTLKANYMIWPLANVVNYSYVPLHYRILFINCVNLVWTTVLSTISSRSMVRLPVKRQKEKKIGLPTGEETLEC